MGLFKSKPVPPAPPDVTARLAGSIAGSEVVDGRVRLPHTGALVTVRQADARPGSTTATLHVWVDHPGWDRTFFDAASGNGPTPEAAVDAALFNVGLHVVHLLDHAAVEPPDETITTTWQGQSHDWSVWQGYITAMGTGQSPVSLEGEPYWHLLKTGLAERLGNQKVTYVKVTAARFADITAEVRINNVISRDLTTILYDHIQNTWPADAGVFHKQFLWFVQSDATYRPYPHTAQDIRAAVIQAGTIFDELWRQPGEFSRNEWGMRLDLALRDPWLASEIVSLVPEITASSNEGRLPVSDTATIKAADATYTVNLPQLASYAHLVDAVDATWCGEVPERVIGAWIGYSALGHATAQIREANVAFDQVSPIELTYQMCQGYEPR